MHILTISHNYPTRIDPSYGFFCKDQAEALALQGVKVGVVGALLISLKTFSRWKLIDFGFKKSKSGEGVFTSFCVLPSIPKFAKLRAWIIFAIGKRLVDSYVKEHGKPDLIHLQVYLAGEVAIYASKKFNVPLVWTEHFSNVVLGKFATGERQIMEKVVSHAHLSIGVSIFFCNELEKKLGRHFHFVPNVYRDSVFYFGNLNRPEEFTYIHVGYFNPIKNHKRLIRAFASIASTAPVVLKLVGNGECYGEIKELVDELNVTQKVFFKGELSSEEIAEELRSSHACVISSDLETFNVSLVEAMACGLPVISTCCGGPETIINNPRLGILTKKDDGSLAQGMLTMLNNYSTYSPSFISNYVYENYSSVAIGKKLSHLLKGVLQSQKAE